MSANYPSTYCRPTYCKEREGERKPPKKNKKTFQSFYLLLSTQPLTHQIQQNTVHMETTIITIVDRQKNIVFPFEET